MQNSLFTLNPGTVSDRGTDSDVVFGKTHGKTPHKRINEKPVTTCHSVTNRAEALVLKTNLERRGVLLTAENGAIVCDGNSAVIDRFATDIVRLKPELLALLESQTVHRWRDESPDVAAPGDTATPPTSARCYAPNGDWIPTTPDEIAARARFDLLRDRLGIVGARRAVQIAGKAEAAKIGDAWHKIPLAARHDLAVSIVLLDNGIDPEQPTNGETK